MHNIAGDDITPRHFNKLPVSLNVGRWRDLLLQSFDGAAWKEALPAVERRAQENDAADDRSIDGFTEERGSNRCNEEDENEWVGGSPHELEQLRVAPGWRAL